MSMFDKFTSILFKQVSISVIQFVSPEIVHSKLGDNLFSEHKLAQLYDDGKEILNIMKNKEKDEYKERIDEINNGVESSKELQHSPITYFQPKGLYRPMQ